MIIYLEGADCAGKSTLVERLTTALVRQYEVTVLHAGRPDPNVDIMRQYIVPLTAALNPESALILDRWHLGELVYGPLRRGASRLSLGQAAYLDLLMQSYGFSGVHCVARSDQLIGCFDRRGDEDPTVLRDRLITESERFHEVIEGRRNWTYVNVLDLDDELAYTQVLLDIIKRATPVVPFARAPLWLAGAYIGSRWPRLLLVGDRRNPNDTHVPLPWPFVPWKPTSGRWMFDALASNGVPTGDLGFINGQERGPGELRAAWTALGSPPVLALGQYANTACHLAGVPVTAKTNHPQWWRRFKYRETKSFADTVTEVMR